MNKPFQLIQSGWQYIVDAFANGQTVPATQRVLLESLEERLLYDASPLAALISHPAEVTSYVELVDQHFTDLVDLVGQQLADHPALIDGASFHEFNLDPTTLLTSQHDLATHQLIVVDERVDNIQKILQDLKDNSDPTVHQQIIQLSQFVDGIDQVTALLNGGQKFDSVHIISHGSRGQLQLGSSQLTSQNLATFQTQLSSWSTGLNSGADILFYGCNVASGADGQYLVDQISAWTGADVAASNDLTGSADRGGDWDLEFNVGVVTTDVAFSYEFRSTWENVLAIYTVTNTNDTGAGSLRNAIAQANATVGVADTINFAISGTGVHTINVASSLTISDAVTINATTDDSFAANSNRPAIILDGNNSFTGDGFVLTSTADGTTIRGFVIRDFTGDGIEIQANSNNNSIAGNYIGRMTATGADAGAGEANTGAGINLLGSNNTIGGTTAADRNVIAGNADGIYLQSASGNIIRGNYIGTDGTGLLDLGNSDRGIQIESGANNTIVGGVTAAARNVISGNDNDGIIISDGASPGTGTTGTVIQGNYIGVGSDGTTAIGNTTNGVRITTESGHTIGGTAAGAGNVIANNVQDGIVISGASAITNSILGNAIYSNGQLGIDLGDNGITANDAGDSDTGANNLQNFPVLTSASSATAGTTIVGSLNSNANTTFRIEFFANRPSIADATNGEGERYLGFTTITTDGSGNATINTTLTSVWVNAGDKITATATVDLGGGNYTNTSEFGVNITATSTGIIVVDTTSNVSDGTTTSITNLGNARGADGRISLREAIAAANATANGGSPDKIVFNIGLSDVNHVYYRDNAVGGTFATAVATTLSDTAITDFDSDYASGTARSWYRITLGTTSLDVTQALIIDGSTQFGYDSAKGPIIEINAVAVTGGDANAIALTTGASTIRGLVINNADDNAIEVDTGAGGSIIVGNYFGTDVSGTKALGNSAVGTWGTIAIKSNNVIVGGSSVADRNLISGNFGYGIELYNSSTGAVIKGNYIGTTVTGGGALGNSAAGIYIHASAASNTIGGTGANEGNIIANNTGDGIWLDTDAGTGTKILGNSFFSNTGLGIDLGANGVTANDALDSDTGANSLQNFPVLTSAAAAASGTTIVGSLNSNANTTFRIEFYAIRPSIADASNGEGERYLGFVTVTTDGSGNATINTTLNNVWINAGDKVSATATVDLGGGSYSSTSEFGANITATSTGIVVVDTTSDVSDGTTTSITNLGNARGADGRISLREAIAATNATAGTDKIVFNIAGTGTRTITIGATALPDITGTVIIDGWTNPDYVGAPVIELNGNNAGTSVEGLILAAGSSGSTIRGLIINRFTGHGIEFSGSSNHVIEGNWIGLSSTGLAAAANLEHGIHGFNSSGNLIGGTTDASRNVITGNSQQGIFFDNVDSSTISGNYVGTNAAGTGDVNGSVADTFKSGIFVQNGSSNNIIGGLTAGARNVISGNNHFGFEVLNATSQNNLLQGNYIGTDATGLVALGNINGGATFWGAGTGNVFGGSSAAARNVIAGNAFNGVVVGNASAGATIQGNYIGVGADGTTLVANGSAGIKVEGGATGTRIGTNADGSNDAAEGNVISGNSYGVQVSDSGTTGTIIAGNIIGLAADGSTIVANSSAGVSVVSSAGSVLIGGATSVSRNVISGNDSFGVYLGSTTSGSSVLNNYIGTNAAGTVIRGNLDGVWIDGSANNTIGQTGAGNVISGSTYYGITVDGAGATGNAIRANLIGLDATGTVNLGNGAQGILISNGAGSTSIGGTTAGQGNTIAFNAGDGVYVSAGTSNSILGNSIYSNTDQGIDLGTNGVTANDTGDGDTGANALQNFPVLTTAITNGTQVLITGTFNSTASTTFRIEFFSSTTADGSGYGEGQTYLGFATISTDGSGNATINSTLTASVSAGSIISATATNNTTSNTSEFAQNVTAITDTNDAPVFTSLNGTPGFTEGGSAVVIDSNVTIFDAELSALNNFSGATLTLVRNGGASAQDVYSATGTLSALTQGGSLVVGGTTIGTVTSNSSGTLVLTFNASATNALVNSAMQQIAYSNNSDTPPATAQINWTFNDNNSGAQGTGGALTATGNTVVTITATNDQAVFTSLDGTPTFTEAGSAVVLDANVTILDAELSALNNFSGATLTLVRNGGASAQDVYSATGTLSALTQGGSLVVGGTTIGTVTTNSSGTLVLTFNASATNALVNSVMQQIAYSNNSDTPPVSAQINWTFSDGNSGAQGTGGALAATGNIVVTITATNDQAVFTSLNGTPTFTEAGSAVVLDSNVTIFDAELSALNNFSGATLTLVRNGGASAQDVYSATGTLSALTQGGSLVVGGTTIGTVTTNSSGTLVLTFNASATNALVNSVMQQIAYSNNSDTPPVSAQINWTFSDGNSGAQGTGGALAATGNIVVTITATNDQAVFTSLNGTPTFTEAGSAVVLDSNVTIFDAELSALNNFSGATLTLVRNGGASSQDVYSATGTLSALTQGGSLVVGGTTVGTVTTNSAGTLVLTFNASATNALVNSAIQQIAYSNNSDTPPASAQINWTFNDSNSGAQGTGGALSATGSTVVSITATNDQAAFTSLDGTPTFTEGGAAVVLDANVTIFDAELSAANNFSGATLTLVRNGGASAQDVYTATGTLSALTQGGSLVVGGTTIGTVTTNSAGTLLLTFNANATNALVNSAMQQTAYSNSSDTPPASAQINWTFNDNNSGSQGTGGALTATGNTVVTITATNDQPAFTSLNGTPTLTEGGSAVVLDSDVTIFDAELSTANNFSGATLTLVRNGGASAQDVYSATGTLSALTQGGSLIVGGTTIGTVTTNSSGTLVLTFNASATNALVNSAMQQIAYSNNSDTPPASAQINWTFNDNNSGVQGTGGALSASGSTTVSITATNDAPTLTTFSSPVVTVNEDTQATITFADLLAAGNEADVDGTVAAFVVKTVSSGTLLIGTSAGTATAWVAGTNDIIDATRQGYWTGALDANGTLNAFTVVARDDGGLVSAGAVQAQISVTAVNDVPIRTAGSVGNLTVLEDSLFTSLGFGGLAYSPGGGADESGQTLSYQVTSIPAAGLGKVYLADGTTEVTLSTFYTLAQIQGMQFKPTANANGVSAFQFNVVDSGGTADGGVDNFSEFVLITVTAVNDAPVITTTGSTLAYTENAVAIEIDTALTLTDIDSANMTGSVVKISANYVNGQDILAFTNQLGITGSWNASTGELTLSGTTSTANYQTALRSITYINSSDAPITATRTVSFAVNDGTLDSVTATRNVSVMAVNDAPVLDNTGNMTLTTITEDNTNNSGDAILTIFNSAGGDRVTDPDSAIAFEGMAITGLSSGNGTWEYTIDGTNWFAVGSVSDSSALLLRDTDRLRFVPDGQNGTSASVTFRAWDQTGATSGQQGTKVDTSTNGTTTPFSSATEVASITVTSVNDASVLDGSGVMSLTTITEDDTSTSGNTIAQIIASAGGDRITDVDSGAVEGIALFFVTGSNGTWQYNTGSGWTDVGTVSASSALLLRATDSLRFLPNGLNSGTGTMLFQAWDQTSGTFGTKVDTSINGTTTAFSATVEVASITVTAVNDAPVLSDTALGLTVAEDAGVPTGVVGSLISSFTSGVSDVDSGAVKGIVITASVETDGIWYYTTDNGTNWIAVSSVSSASSLLLADNANTRLYFAPGVNYNGTSASALTIRGWDQTSGTAGTRVDTSSNGGITAYSAATDVVDVTVTSVLDYPDGTDNTVTTNEDTGYAFTVADFGFSDVDAGDSMIGVIINTLPAAGILRLNGTAISGGTFVLTGEINSGLLVYTPAQDGNGSNYASFTFSVLDSTVLMDQAPNTMTINVTAVNDEQVLATNTGVTVLEGSTGSVITQLLLQTTDVDNTPAQLVYTLSSVPTNGTLKRSGVDLSVSSTFTQADINAGLITYLHNDTETTSDSFSFTVDDGVGSISSGTFNISVTPVNETPTDITPNSFNVNENIDTTTSYGVGTLATTDPDSGETFTYTIVGGADQAKFSISGNQLVLTDGILNFETKPSYTVTIRTTDSGGLWYEETLTVNVNDLNETPTDIAPNSFSINENTNTTAGVSVGTLTSTDVDSGETFTYTVVGGTDQAKFSISGNQLVLTDGILNFETKPSYSVTIRTTDSGGLWYEETLTVNVNDLNDTPTDIAPNSFSINENTNTTAGFSVGTLTSTDVDSGETFTYTVVGGADQAKFSVSGNQLVLTDGILNFETKPSYTVTIRTTDGGGLWYEETLTVNVNDLNETPTDIAPNSFSINENTNTTAGVSVGTLTSTDVDSGETFTYTVVGGADQAKFTISANQLVLTDGILNFETKPSYTVTIRTTDSGGLWYEETLTVNVNDLNETPTDIAPNSFSINENTNTTTGVSVGTLSSTDVDSGETFTYTVVGGTDQAKFSISGNQLVLTDGILNFESKPSYTVTIRTTDGGGLWYEETLTVNVNDLNETPTDIAPNSFSINENTNTTAGVSVGTLTSTDVDSGETFTYTVVGGADQAKFTISANQLVLTDGILNFETKPSYTVTIRTTDSGGLWYEETLTVNVNDLNETPTGIAPNSFNVNENVDTTAGFSVGTLTSTDVDSGETFTYTVVGGADQAKFTISANQLVLTDGILNFETKPSYTVTIRTTDSGGLWYEETLTVNVNDLNETPTDIAPNSFSINENTNTTAGFSVGTLTSTDVDSGETFTYTVVGGADQAKFSISGNQLVLTDGILNFETKPSYTVTIRTTDSGGLWYEETLTVNVNDLNETPTDIAPNSFSINENTNTTAGVSVGTLTSTDVDSGETFTYTVVGGADQAKFTISANQLVLTDGILNFETKPSYTVTIRTTDSGGLWYEETLTINVNNLNETPTDIAPNSFNVNENVDTTTGYSVGTLTSTDVDSGETFTYTVVGGADQTKFSISGNQLVLTDGVLNFETKPSYSVTIRTTDSGGLWYEETLTINVNNLNETPTDIAPNSFNVNENVDTTTGYSVGTLTSSDVDSGDTFTYSVVGGADQAKFSVSGNQLVLTNGILNFETKPSYSVTIRTTDSGGLWYEETLTINVNNLNETPTDIAPNSFNVNENVDTTTGYSVGTLTSTDQDSGDTFTYSVVGGADQAKFSISGNQLALTDGVLDFETKSSYMVTVRVTDSGGLTYDETLTINVVDLNEAPVLNNQAFNVNENSANGTSVGFVAAGDVDAGDTIGYAITGGSGSTAFTINSLTGEITVADISQLDFETTSLFTLTIEVTDSGGLTDTATITINLNDINDEQVLNTNVPLNVNEGAAGTIAASLLSTSDQDHAAASIVYTITAAPANGILRVNGVPALTFTQDDVNNGRVTYLHNGSETSIDSFDFTVDDGVGAAATGTFAISINPVNDAPVANNDVIALNEGGTFNGVTADLLGNDFDAEGATLTATLVSGPANGTLLLNPDGSFTYTHNGSETTTDSFSYRVNDGSLNSNIATVVITVVPVNEAPVGVSESYTTLSGLVLQDLIGVLANDWDAENSPVIAILAASPAKGTVVLNANGSFLYTPNAGFFGVDSFAYMPNDGSLSGNLTVVTITVVAVPPPPTGDSGNGGGNPPIDPPKDTDPDPQPSEDGPPNPNVDPVPIPSLPFVPSSKTPDNFQFGISDSFESLEDLHAYAEQLTDAKQAEAVLHLLLSNNSSEIIRDAEDIRRLRLSSGIGVAFDAQFLWKQLDDFVDNHQTSLLDFSVTVGAITTVGTLGYIFWSLRGGILIAAALSQMPTWRMIDPLPVLESYSMDTKKEEVDEVDEFFES